MEAIVNYPGFCGLCGHMLEDNQEFQLIIQSDEGMLFYRHVCFSCADRINIITRLVSDKNVLDQEIQVLSDFAQVDEDDDDGEDTESEGTEEDDDTEENLDDENLDENDGEDEPEDEKEDHENTMKSRKAKRNALVIPSEF